MQQLLRITSTPIQYQYQVERARLEMKQAQNAQMRSRFKPATLDMRQKNIEVRLDTTEARRSIGLENVGDKISQAAQKGLQVADSATDQYAKEGLAMAVPNGMSIAQIISQKILQENSFNTTTVFLPTSGPAISWDPATLNIQYNASQLNTEFTVQQNVMNFVPGKFQIIIEQYPKVQIEYLGDPNYVPPSANPNYTAG